MKIIVIRHDYSTIKILIGANKKEIEKHIEELNNNPLSDGHFECEELEVDKTVYQLATFFDIN